MRTKWLWVFLTIILIFLTSGVSSAHEVLQGDECIVEADETISGDLFVLCRTLTINGVVEGNLIGAAYTAEINGHVEDDIYLAAGQLNVRGVVGQNLVFAGPVFQVNPTASFADDRGDVISLSLSTQIFKEVSIPGSLTSVSYQLLMDGKVGRGVSFWGSAFNIGGQIEGDVNATVGDPRTNDASQLETLLVPFQFDVKLVNPGLILSEEGRIEGQLQYTSPVVGQIDGQLTSEPIFVPIITRPDFALSEEQNAAWFGEYLSDVLREFISLLFIGMIGLLLLPGLMQSPLRNLRWRPFTSLGVGILTFFMSFVVVFIVLLLLLLAVFVFLLLQLGDLAIVGGLALGVLEVGGASLFYFVAIYVSRVIVCLALGRVIVWGLWRYDNSPRALYISLLIGVAILAVLVWIPLIGWIFNGLALGFGLGAICLSIAQFDLRARAATAQPPLQPGTSRPIPPPPMIDEKSSAPGMDNLPAGFQWWKND
jgi:cytoskeletal protein CcmA (bactofilin family)